MWWPESSVTHLCNSVTSVIILLMFHGIAIAQETTADSDNSEVGTTIVTTQADDVPFIETYVTGPFKVWHVGMLAAAGIAALVIGICCVVDIRVPRTKEEIEANYEKRQAAHKYIDKLGQMEFTGLPLKSQARMIKERELKKKEKEKEKGNNDKTSQQGKQQLSQQSQQMRMPLAYHPGMMGMNSGMMGFHPGMMQQQMMMNGQNQQGMMGQTQRMMGQQGMPMANMMMPGMVPGMMASQGMLGSQQALNREPGNQTPLMARSASATGINILGQPAPKVSSPATSRWKSLAKTVLDPQAAPKDVIEESTAQNNNESTKEEATKLNMQDDTKLKSEEKLSNAETKK